MLYPGYYLPEDRAKRIVGLIENKNDWDRASFAEMINDTRSLVAVNLIDIIFSDTSEINFTTFEEEAMTLLQNWNGDHHLDDVGAIIYHRLIYRFLENTYLDELDETLFNQFLKTHLVKRTIAKQINNESSIWWDDISTIEKETRSDILLKSFKEAVASLKTQLGTDMNAWRWGTIHTLEHGHALGTVETLKPYFNLGPFEVPGSMEVINNMAFDFNNSGEYKVKAGPSTRRIIDFSDIENSWSIIPTGQSGNPFSKHYSDQAALYNKGDFRKMMLNKEEILKTSTLLTLKPKS